MLSLCMVGPHLTTFHTQDTKQEVLRKLLRRDWPRFTHTLETIGTTVAIGAFVRQHPFKTTVEVSRLTALSLDHVQTTPSNEGTTQ